jgi:Flp pilus assembly protein TadD
MILSACAPVTQQSQLKFGIQAAQSRLWDEAVFRWKKVLRDNPASAAAHNNLAVAYERLGRFDEAEKEYHRALELAPGHEHIEANYNNFKKNLEALEEEAKPSKKKEKKEC